ncbi:hypothetical protein, partial [uncultured Weissella sp.]|uniref:hypothetical protein n=1 Tax=uncultured Weissella sp. TaxID=253243 RepID=UPI00258FF079
RISLGWIFAKSWFNRWLSDSFIVGIIISPLDNKKPDVSLMENIRLPGKHVFAKNRGRFIWFLGCFNHYPRSHAKMLLAQFG